MKFLILILSLVQELQLVQEKATDHNYKCETKDEYTLCQPSDDLNYAVPTTFIKKFANLFSSLLVLEINFTYLKGIPFMEEKLLISSRMVFVGLQEELVSFATASCSIFWSNVKSDETGLPSSVKGKLGGPSQRRLPSYTATLVLLAV